VLVYGRAEWKVGVKVVKSAVRKAVEKAEK
jgi:hypothetical protein